MTFDAILGLTPVIVYYTYIDELLWEIEEGYGEDAVLIEAAGRF